MEVLKSERSWCLYCHETPSGKRYIGITSLSPQKRWQNGRGYKKCPYFYRAIEKYGWDNIKHEVLFTGLSKSEAAKLEIEYISKYKTRDKRFGYNMTDGGEGHLGVPMAEEQKEKLRCLMTGKPKSETTKERLRIANSGKRWNEEQKQRRSIQYSGQGNPRFGTHCSDETKAKISASQKGKTISEEQRKMISEYFSKPIYCTDLDRVFSSSKEFADYIGCDDSTVSSALNGKRGKPPTNRVFGHFITREIPHDYNQR